MQFYRLTDFYLSGHGLSEFRHYCPDVRSGTDYYRIDWPFCISAQALSFAVGRYGDCLARSGYYLCGWQRSAYSADWHRPDVAQCFYLLRFDVLGEKS